MPKAQAKPVLVRFLAASIHGPEPVEVPAAEAKRLIDAGQAVRVKS